MAVQPGSVWDQVKNPEDRFSHNEAHLVSFVHTIVDLTRSLGRQLVKYIRLRLVVIYLFLSTRSFTLTYFGKCEKDLHIFSTMNINEFVVFMFKF